MWQYLLTRASGIRIVSVWTVFYFSVRHSPRAIGVKEELMRLIKPIVLHCRWQVDT